MLSLYVDKIKAEEKECHIIETFLEPLRLSLATKSKSLNWYGSRTAAFDCVESTNLFINRFFINMEKSN